MFTDIVGYSALTQRDEALALRVLERHNELIRPVLSRHGGLEVKTIGDSFLVEFASALDATECAIELQKKISEYNHNASEKIMIRVGIHVGDVVHTASDVFGDAVNIASRIEPLARGGGICITDQVYAQVQNKMALEARKLETRQLKNISIPISVYEIQERGGERKMETELDMQRLAVLPFANISPDPNDGYFADGLTEELISKLSLVKDLKVIARTSVMKYKGKEKSISEIGRELGTGTLVEGSVRKAGNRIRVTVQVINANNEEHLWASNYDNSLDDIFAVQAEIADKVSRSLSASIPSSKRVVEVSRDTNNITSYTHFLRAEQLMNEGSADSMKEALELFNHAIELDPNFARAYVGMGNVYAQLGMRSRLSREEAASGMRLGARKALQLDPNLAEAHALASFLGWADDDHDLSEKEAKKALELNPNLSEVHVSLSRVMMSKGYPQSAIKALEKAYSLDPLSGEVIRHLALMLSWTGKDSEAFELLKRNSKIAPFESHLGLAEYFIGKKDYAKAEEEVGILENISPSDFNTVYFRAYLQAASRDKQGLDQALVRFERSFRSGATYERNLGYIKYLLGDIDGFFEAMFRSQEGHTLDPMRMRYSPIFEKAREDQRYRKLLESNGLEPDLKEPLK